VSDRPCTCGHDESKHRVATNYDGSMKYPYCRVCYSNLTVLGTKSLSIHEFKLDNLKYLEQAYEQSR